ncbi:LPS-assembly protein LptD [Pelagibacterium lacus]|uniref:LPS-assembly protein LptD n=1 Tax=Pelagibacterium lacus TaxID=2282655 RepID=UPI00131457B2|nr:LPS assembly protein LptD [Pelagibacterium lacus]
MATAILLALSPSAAAQQIIPANFFSQIPSGAAGQMAVAADTLVFNETNDTVVANGNVGISFEGFRATADRAVYHQSSGRVELIGNVAVVDPDGIEYVADRVELEDGFREGFIQSLTAAFPDGSHFSAASTRFREGVQRVFDDGTYAPCGTCIDANGNRIGWSIKAARIITDEAERVIYFEQPSLQLLGHTVVSLSHLTLSTDEGLDLPILSYDRKYGVGISLPFFTYPVADGRLALTPSIYTNQGVGLSVDWQQEIGALRYGVATSGVYQLNPDAYRTDAGVDTLGARKVRGALQTSGAFTGLETWTLGWSYTAFTDPGYLVDYRIASDDFQTNEIYARHLDGDTYADIRIEQFVPVDDDYTSWAQYDADSDRQALTHPNAEFDRVIELGDDAGRIELAGRLLGLSRAADHTGSGYVFGHEGQSVHAMMQASWTNQYIVPGGFAVTPYLGLRGDGASYDGASTHPGAPAAQTLFSATPIAALDVRYPLMARTSGATTVIEPIAQLVYRGGPTDPGIINNDSQSLVLDTASLFDYDRFGGSDRQETGLKSNVGAMLTTSFDAGGWLTAALGQSYHLAGPNGVASGDGSPAGLGSSLDRPASFVVGSLEAGYGGLSGGARVQFDPETGAFPAVNGRLSASVDGYSLSGTYAWAGPVPALGVTESRQDIGVELGIPVADYWTVRTGVSYDLIGDELIKTTASVEYDDRFLAYGIGARFNGPVGNWADDFAVAVQFRLSTAGTRNVAGFDYDFGED